MIDRILSIRIAMHFTKMNIVLRWLFFILSILFFPVIKLSVTTFTSAAKVILDWFSII